jgi:hypothetical protein
VTIYRLYRVDRSRPIKEFTGDDIVQNGQYVQITADDGRRTVVAFNLEPGQYIADASGVNDTGERD